MDARNGNTPYVSPALAQLEMSLILELATKDALEAIFEVLFQEIGGDEEHRDRRRALRRKLFWWIFSRSSVLLSLMTLAKFTLVFRMRMKKIKWLENPCAFDTGNLLRGLQF